MKRAFKSIGEPNPFHPAYSLTQPANNLRVLQFNILADGLSGLRADLGGFSRVKKDFMVWEYRRNLLLAEILQYDPDIITLQECDHYYDFFFPMLYSQGYDGVFAPKPASACLEVSSNPDGCAIFYRRSKLKVLSSEIGTYALSKTELKGLPPQKDKSIQNQVYAILCLQFLANAHSNGITDQSTLTPALILATTHLKASKTEEGERFRFLEVKELLENIKIFEENLRRHQGKRAAILLTGDLNACPSKPSVGVTESVGEGKVAYDSSVYQYLKAHSYKFRSVLNDDLQDLMHSKPLTPFNTPRINTSFKEKTVTQQRLFGRLGRRDVAVAIKRRWRSTASTMFYTNHSTRRKGLAFNLLRLPAASPTKRSIKTISFPTRLMPPTTSQSWRIWKFCFIQPSD